MIEFIPSLLDVLNNNELRCYHYFCALLLKNNLNLQPEIPVSEGLIQRIMHTINLQTNTKVKKIYAHVVSQIANNSQNLTDFMAYLKELATKRDEFIFEVLMEFVILDIDVEKIPLFVKETLNIMLECLLNVLELTEMGIE